MSAREITVNTSTLTGDIEELRETLSGVGVQLEEMFNQVKELDTMWDGPANKEFNLQFGNDYENAKSLCKTVESLLECMEFARNEYNSCENEVNTIVSAISI